MKPTKLSNVDRERVTDSVLKIQSVRASLNEVEEGKIPKRDEMENCLEGVDHGLREILGYPQRRDQTGFDSPKSRG